jgi:predicted nucleotidyltransferase
MLTDHDIARLSRRVVEAYAPLVVGTFGSYAVGNARDRSDLDLVVIKETPEAPAARARAVQRLLFGVFHPLDVHVFTPEEFEDTVYEELSFTWIIARQARLYHWTDEARTLVPSLLRRSAGTATSPVHPALLRVTWEARDEG